MGPAPKPSALRQRRNKVSTHAVLPPPDASRPVPPLPERAKGERPWHPETLDYWRRIWASEMAAEYVDADIPGLVALMKLTDQYNHTENALLLAEIRLQRQCFGLTPIDRRRLQWEVSKVEDVRRKQSKGEVRQPTKANDPRRWLMAVK